MKFPLMMSWGHDSGLSNFLFFSGELVITEDAPSVADRNSDEDDEEVDVDSVDDVDPRDR